MQNLFVFFENQKVGTLSRSQDLVYSFQYSDPWLQSPSRFPLSLHLVLEPKQFGNKETLAFFENLLPEGDARASLEKSQNIASTFDFLAKYGQDCAGAITITPNENYRHLIGNENLIQIEESKIIEAIREKRSVAEVLAEESPGYLSLAGAQDKFPAIYKNQKFYLSQTYSPTTHIVKVPIFRNNITDSVYNEFYCMRLAKKIGLNVPYCFIHDTEFPLYVVERYDRSRDKNHLVHRLHQQDFCQAQGITSEFKYERNNGPTIKNNYDLILKSISIAKRMEAVQTFLDWICFNLIIGNNDSHSKNISILLQNSKYEMAPLYDLLCTAIYSKLQKYFAFHIGDRNDFATIGKNQFILMDGQLGLRAGTSMERLQLMSDKITKEKDSLAHEVLEKYPNVKIVPRIQELIQDRIKGLRVQNAIV